MAGVDINLSIFPPNQGLNPGSQDFLASIIIVCSFTVVGIFASCFLASVMAITPVHLNEMRRGDSKKRKKMEILVSILKRSTLVEVSMTCLIVISIVCISIYSYRLLGNPILALGVSFCGVVVLISFSPKLVGTAFASSILVHLRYLMWLFVLATVVISYPLSGVLEGFLESRGLKRKGGGGRLLYGRSEFRHLVEIHGENDDLEEGYSSNANLPWDGGDGEGGDVKGAGYTATLTENEVRIIRGALNMREKVVLDAMVDLDRAFMLPDSAILDVGNLKLISKSGHRFVPIYHGSRDLLVGVVHTSALISVNPSNGTTIDSLDIWEVPRVVSNMPLYTLLEQFKKGRVKLAIVLDSRDQLTPLGLITMKDVFECLIESTILDMNVFMRMDEEEAEEERKLTLSLDYAKSHVTSDTIQPTDASPLLDTPSKTPIYASTSPMKQFPTSNSNIISTKLHVPPLLTRQSTLKKILEGGYVPQNISIRTQKGGNNSTQVVLSTSVGSPCNREGVSPKRGRKENSGIYSRRTSSGSDDSSHRARRSRRSSDSPFPRTSAPLKLSSSTDSVHLGDHTQNIVESAARHAAHTVAKATVGKAEHDKDSQEEL